MKTLIIASLASVLIVWAAFRAGKETGVKEEVVKQQDQQIQVQNEIIKTQKDVVKRKMVNLSTPIDDDVDWLQHNACEDCNP